MDRDKKRESWRAPMQLLVKEYVAKRTQRSLAVNVGPDGVFLNRLAQAPPEITADGPGDATADEPRDASVVDLEFELPGSSEIIWARGKICHEQQDSLFHGRGVRFTHIAEPHRRLLRDYVNRYRASRLRELVHTVRRNRLN